MTIHNLTPTEIQRNDALALANRVRVRKARLKDEIRADATWETACNVILGKHGAAGASMRLREALTAAPALGPGKARKIVNMSGAFAGGASLDPRVGVLTVRQRALLVNTIRRAREVHNGHNVAKVAARPRPHRPQAVADAV